ncbi:unnamed protein product [Ceratitis capitata]|uniref:(Mediterranean fruit fly) hypothetical protein n=1 Tax=Ceratitis capitata TaxID=7213 RepID=A0A811V435_CERCA|nr:unnamed protein product [Ceratitis capitata]
MSGILAITDIFESFDNVYLLSTVTMLAAVLLAFYISNVVKDIGMSSTPAEQKVENQSNTTTVKETLYDTSGDEEFDTDNPLGDGLLGKMKSARLKELEAQLTHDQLEEERRIEREQLAAIFELLKKQEADLNVKEIDERELVAQLNLYR